MAISSPPSGLTNLQHQYSSRERFELLTISERRILGLVLRGESITQASVTRSMDVAQQTVSRLVASLSDRALLVTKDRISEGKRGQPSTVLELEPGAMYSIGFTIMADTVSFAVMDFAGQVISELQIEPSSMRPGKIIKACRRMYDDTLKRLGIEESKVLGIGVAVTGYFVSDRAGFNTPPTLPEWAFVDVEEAFNREFDLPVWAENDGNAAAIGESMIGVGRWADNFAYLYVSSGIGGGVVMNGELLRGDLGNAGEFGGILPYNVYPHPTLELLRQICCRDGVQIDSIHQLVAEFDPSWPSVDEWVHKTQAAFSIIASAAAAILDCTAIVLGGRMPKQLAERLIPSIEFYNAPRRSHPRPTPKVVAAEADGEVTAIGAASLPLRAMYFR